MTAHAAKSNPGSLSRTRRVLVRTLLQAIPTILGIICINFVLLTFMPGDAADAFAASAGSASKETMAALRESLGLDQPLLARMLGYLRGLVSLDLGYSISNGAPVLNVILQRLPNTLALMVTALVFAYLVGVAIGWIMAVFAGRWPDRVLTFLVLLLYSAPGFWLGLLAIVLFSVNLRWLPSSGHITIGAQFSPLEAVLDYARHLILPALALASYLIAIYARLTRASMLDVMRQDYIRAAASKGLHPITLQFRHGLRNALIPVTTMAGLHLANLLGGAVVVETVFGWPGLGRLTLDAVMSRDFNILLGIVLLSSIVVIIVNAVMDLVVGWLDPRIEVS